MDINKYIKILKFIFITGSTSKGYSQQKPDSLQLRLARQQHAFYRKILQVDSVKAQKVSQIQDNYNASINQLMADTGFNQVAKRIRVKRPDG